MGEWKLWHGSRPPEWTTPEWYGERPSAHHLEEGVHRPRLFKAAQYVSWARVKGYGPAVVDIGCGDGGLLSMIGAPCWGYDLQPSNVDYAHHVRQVDVRYGNVVDEDPDIPIEWGEIVVCTEMLEHLVDPHAFVEKIGKHAQVLIASSPSGERPGNAYAFHTWAWDQRGYLDLMKVGGFKPYLFEQIDMGPGWTIVMATK